MLILDYPIKATPSVFKYYYFPTQRNQNNLLHLNLHSSAICQLNKTIDIIYTTKRGRASMRERGRQTACFVYTTLRRKTISSLIKSNRPTYVYNFHID